MIMEHFNGILFLKFGPSNKQHTNQPTNQPTKLLEIIYIMVGRNLHNMSQLNGVESGAANRDAKTLVKTLA